MKSNSKKLNNKIKHSQYSDDKNIKTIKPIKTVKTQSNGIKSEAIKTSRFDYKKHLANKSTGRGMSRKKPLMATCPYHPNIDCKIVAVKNPYCDTNEGRKNKRNSKTSV